MITLSETLVTQEPYEPGRRALIEKVMAAVAFADTTSLREIARLCHAASDHLRQPGMSAKPARERQVGFLAAVSAMADEICRGAPSQEAQKAVEGAEAKAILECVHLLGTTRPSEIAGRLKRPRQNVWRTLKSLSQAGVLNHWPDLGAYTVSDQGSRMLSAPPWTKELPRASSAIRARLKRGPAKETELVEEVSAALTVPTAVAKSVASAILGDWLTAGVVRMGERRLYVLREPDARGETTAEQAGFVRSEVGRTGGGTPIGEVVALSDVQDLLRGVVAIATAPGEGVQEGEVSIKQMRSMFDNLLATIAQRAFVLGERKALSDPELSKRHLEASEDQR